MKEAADCTTLPEIREMIDLVDQQIVKLIAQRAQYVKQAAKFKKDADAMKDQERVQQVIESKKAMAMASGASPELIEKVYRLMIDFFIEEEMKEWKSKS